MGKHGICHLGCIWIWIHNICKGFNVQCNIHISKFVHTRSWDGLSISNLERTKLKQHTSLQTKCRTLWTGKNNATTQITSLHVDSCKEMKKGNSSIHVGIIISNSPSFECWTQINLFSFGVTCFLSPNFYTTLDFASIWVCLNCWVVDIIEILTWKTWHIICWC